MLSREKALAAAANLARGSYQASLVGPRTCWSGADLRGNAKKYGSRYGQSRREFARRLGDALGGAVRFAKGPKGRDLVIYGTRFVAAYQASCEQFAQLSPLLSEPERTRLHGWLRECAQAAEYGHRQPPVPSELPPRAQVAEMAR